MVFGLNSLDFGLSTPLRKETEKKKSTKKPPQGTFTTAPVLFVFFTGKQNLIKLIKTFCLVLYVGLVGGVSFPSQETNTAAI